MTSAAAWRSSKGHFAAIFQGSQRYAGRVVLRPPVRAQPWGSSWTPHFASPATAAKTDRAERNADFQMVPYTPPEPSPNRRLDGKQTPVTPLQRRSSIGASESSDLWTCEKAKDTARLGTHLFPSPGSVVATTLVSLGQIRVLPKKTANAARKTKPRKVGGPVQQTRLAVASGAKLPAKKLTIAHAG